MLPCLHHKVLIQSNFLIDITKFFNKYFRIFRRELDFALNFNVLSFSVLEYQHLPQLLPFKRKVWFLIFIFSEIK